MEYLPLVLLITIVVVVASVIPLLSYFLGPKKFSTEKLTPYECGVPLRDPARKSISIKFYIIAILFIIFDVEAIYLYPWAVAYNQLKWFGLVEMAIFLGILAIGYGFIWKKGALQWE